MPIHVITSKFPKLHTTRHMLTLTLNLCSKNAHRHSSFTMHLYSIPLGPRTPTRTCVKKTCQLHVTPQ